MGLLKDKCIFERFPKSKVLVTIRINTHQFRNHLLCCIRQIENASERTVLEIQPLRSTKIQEYISKISENPIQAEKRWEVMRSIPNMKKLFDTPLMLRIYSYHPGLMHIITWEELTKYTLYTRLMELYYARHENKIYEAKKDVPSLKDCTDLCIEYTLCFLRNGTINVTDPEAHEELKIGSNQNLTHGYSRRLFSILQGKTESVRFIHPSFIDFFVALHLKQILDDQSPLLENLGYFNETSICDKERALDFMNDFLDQGYCQRLMTVVTSRRPELSLIHI